MSDLFDGPALSPSARSESWRRARVGLGGIAGILLILATAGSLVDRIGGAEKQAQAGASNSIDPASEPMAELGVAPSAATKEPEAVKAEPISQPVPALKK
jgi:hypothetical protein